MLFQIHSRHGHIYSGRAIFLRKISEFCRVMQKKNHLSSEENRTMWNEEQDNRHEIRVNKGDPQPPLESDGRKNKTKRRAAVSPFDASKRKLNPSDRDMSVKVGSGKIVDLTRVE